MPSIRDFKNYVINGEEDIPIKYRDEIENRLNREEQDIQIQPTSLTTGKRGENLYDIEGIKSIFDDEKEWYLGHGTGGAGDIKITDSILNSGLRVKNSKTMMSYDSHLRGLDSTTIALGNGSAEFFDNTIELFNNWPHKESKEIVIISIPNEFILRRAIIGAFNDQYEAFYYGSEDDGYNLRPEFIRGIFNVEKHKFIENENYYKKLDAETQEVLLKDIRQAYIQSYVDMGIVNPEDVKEMLPLNAQEQEELAIKWYMVQLKRLREDKPFKAQELNEDLQEIFNGMGRHDFTSATNVIRKDAIEEYNLRDEGKGGIDFDVW